MSLDGVACTNKFCYRSGDPAPGNISGDRHRRKSHEKLFNYIQLPGMRNLPSPQKKDLKWCENGHQEAIVNIIFLVQGNECWHGFWGYKRLICVQVQCFWCLHDFRIKIQAVPGTRYWSWTVVHLVVFWKVDILILPCGKSGIHACLVEINFHIIRGMLRLVKKKCPGFVGSRGQSNNLVKGCGEGFINEFEVIQKESQPI